MISHLTELRQPIIFLIHIRTIEHVGTKSEEAYHQAKYQLTDRP